MKSMLRRLAHDTRGAGFVEYIILVGVVALLCVAAFKQFGGDVGDKIKDQGGKVKGIE